MILEDLKGKNIVVYDLEIKKPVDQCSKGWGSRNEMGISVGCMFDYRDMRFRVFMDDNMDELVERLNEPDTLIVAFNHIAFDNKLIRDSGHALNPDSELNNYDMLVVSKEGAGARGIVKGFRLDDHLEASGLDMKSGDGAMAPIWWQEGKIGKVVDYCVTDVIRERSLFEHMCVTGKCASKYQPSPYEIKLPRFV